MTAPKPAPEPPLAAITVAPAMLKRLRDARSSLAEVLAAFNAKAKREDELIAKLETLAAEIAEGEAKLNALDDDACLRLEAKRSQRTAILKTLEANTELDEAEEAVVLKIEPAVAAFRAVLSAELKRQLEEASKPLVKFFVTEQRAIEALKHSPFFRQLDSFSSARFAAFDQDAATARLTIRHLDALLAGKNPFVFDERD